MVICSLHTNTEFKKEKERDRKRRGQGGERMETSWKAVCAVEAIPGGHIFHHHDEVEMSICEWLHIQELNFCHNRFFELMPRWDKCINVHRPY
jgi:hypothetical protein